MKVLLTSIGRRGYLVKYFKEALGVNGEVWGADNSRYAPAFRYCDRAVLLPEVTSSNYVDELLAFCQDNKINMLVPLIDPELTVLAAQRRRFFDAGIMAVVSPPDTVKISGDKYLTYKFGKEKHISVPETEINLSKAKALFKSGRLGWPVVVKPRDGSASTNITYCRNEKQLENAFSNCPNSMIQEYVEGDEFGYDLFSDADYRPISVFCKRKLAMRAGETDKAVSTDDKNLIELGLKIAQAFQIFGPADVDVKTGKDGPMLLEINPRFGGGYPCSHLCGADFPAKLLAICKGQTLTPSIGDYPAGVYMFKQDEIISPTPDGIEAVTDLRRPKAR